MIGPDMEQLPPDADRESAFWGAPSTPGGVAGIIRDEVANPDGVRWEFSSKATDELETNGRLVHTMLLGHEMDWYLYPCGTAMNYAEERYWDLVEDILMSFPGEYDDIPWCFTEGATKKLMA